MFILPPAARNSCLLLKATPIVFVCECERQRLKGTIVKVMESNYRPGIEFIQLYKQQT